MNIFEQYTKAQDELYRISNLISKLVSKYVENTIGFAGEAGDSDNVGKTNKGEFGWSILDNDTIEISYAVYEDKWLDYWSDDKYITVKLNNLLKYRDK